MRRSSPLRSAAPEAANVVGETGFGSRSRLESSHAGGCCPHRPDILWLEGDAANLPFESGRFDAVLCRSALFFFPDVPGAVVEMARVLRPGGVLAIQTYASVEEQPGFVELEAIVAKFPPADAMHLIETYWSQGDLRALGAILADGSLQVFETRTVLGTRGEISATAAESVLREVSRLIDHRYTQRAVLAAAAWKVRENLMFSDALYVALADALAAPLVTLDWRLARVSPDCRAWWNSMRSRAERRIMRPARQSVTLAEPVRHGAVAQLVAHLHGMEGVRGSSPLSSTREPRSNPGFMIKVELAVCDSSCFALRSCLVWAYNPPYDLLS